MKYLRIPALLAVVVAAMALPATASADSATAPSGTLYTGSVSAANEGAITIHGVVDITCSNSSMSGSVATHGSGVLVWVPFNSLTFTNCNQHVKVLAGGGLTFNQFGSGGNAIVESEEAEITVQITSIFGNVHCYFGTRILGTPIGTLTGAASNSDHATLDLSGFLEVLGGSSFLCGSSAEWTGNYKFNSPTGLRVDS
ncbi:MAG TPA: hypothetical protein VI039_11730 [Solirubrobacterales bacterium]